MGSAPTTRSSAPSPAQGGGVRQTKAGSGVHTFLRWVPNNAFKFGRLRVRAVQQASLAPFFFFD